MFLFCKVCGSPVSWENVVLGHLDRNVFSCENKKCFRSVYTYLPAQDPLPSWVNVELSQAN